MTLPIDPRDDQARIPQQSTTAPPEPPAVAAVASPKRRRRRRWPWIAAAAGVVVLVVAGAAYAMMPSDKDTAVERCQAAITDKLKSPSTAKYGDATVTSEDGDFGSYYEVAGKVDAQNGFGAMVRGDYRCKVTLEKDGRWLVTESTVTQG